MDWMDFDRNGVVDGIDFFILNEILDPPKKEESNDFFEDEDFEDEEDEDDLW